MVLNYAVTAALTIAALAIALALARRQNRRLNRRLDTQALALIAIVALIESGEPTAVVPARPERHLHIVRNTSAALVAGAVLLRRHPGRTAAVAMTASLVVGALLALPGSPRRDDATDTLPTAASVPMTGLTELPSLASDSSTAPSAPPDTTSSPSTPRGTTSRPGHIAPTTDAPPFGPRSSTAGSTSQPSPTTATALPSGSPSTPATTASSPPGPPSCLLALDVESLLELKLLCA